MPPAADETPAGGERHSEAIAVLAGGCFWGVQGVFQHVRGVTSAVSGYASSGPDAPRNTKPSAPAIPATQDRCRITLRPAQDQL